MFSKRERERERETLVQTRQSKHCTDGSTSRERERERERDVCVCVFFLNFVSLLFFLLWKLVYVFQSFVSIFAKKSDRTICLADPKLLGPRYNISWNSKSAERAKVCKERNSVVIHR